MAKGTEIDVTDEAQVAGYNPADFEWETVHTEAPDLITFDTIGDTFVGEYIGQEVITFNVIDKKTNEETEESFTQLKFRVGDNHYVVNGGYDLLKAFTDIPAKTVVRVQLRTMVDVGQASPMKSYRIDQARAKQD